MITRQEQMIQAVRELILIFDTASDDNRRALAYLLLNRLTVSQVYVTVVGETSTGKSSLINSLLKQEILPVSAKPTTGTITHIVCRDEVEDLYFAIYQDASQEAIDRSRFVDLNLEPTDDLLRLQVRAQPKSNTNAGLHVFDTPGYNAILTKHEEILQQFLPQSDVIVFVVGYRTGFGQSDQDLLETVEAATALDKDIPLVLVVNRARPGVTYNDRRIVEIVQLAEDSLNRQHQLLIIPSATADLGITPPTHARPNADSLWCAVHNIATDPLRLKAVEVKLEQYVLILLDEAEEAVKQEEALLTANPSQKQDIFNAIATTRDARKKSFIEIERTVANLKLSLPQMLDELASSLKTSVKAEILLSNKWLGHSDCVEWVASHDLPFGVRTIGRQIEDYLAIELEDLNRKLQEIANTAIAELNKKAALRRDDPATLFAISLATSMSRKIAGKAVNSLLGGIGGVGGAAAGAGNITKMAISRAGKLFGKTFGREVYNQIGRLFTKKMLERLNIAVMVLLEVGTFVYEARTWQDKLANKCSESIDDWVTDVKKDMLIEQIPAIRQANIRIIDELYSDNVETDQAKSADGDAARETQLSSIRAKHKKLIELRETLFQ